MLHLVTESVLAAGPDINSDGIVAWGVKNIIPIVLLVIGIGDHRERPQGPDEPERA